MTLSYATFFKIGYCFAFIPFNFKFRIFNQAYATIVTMAVFLGVFRDIFEDPRRKTMSILFFIIIFTSICSIWKTRIWKKWFQLYMKIDSEHKNIFNSPLSFDWPTIWSFLFYISIIICTSVSIYLSSEDYYIIIRTILGYMRFYAIFLPIVHLKILTKGFKILNEYTRCLQSENEIEVIYRMKMNKRNIISCQRLYNNLYNMTECFNKLFSTFLGWCLMDFLISACSWCYFIISTEWNVQTTPLIMYYVLFYGYRTVSIFECNYFAWI